MDLLGGLELFDDIVMEPGNWHLKESASEKSKLYFDDFMSLLKGSMFYRVDEGGEMVKLEVHGL